MKYRIITNGVNFKVQWSNWGLFWNTCWTKEDGNTLYFDTLDKAEIFVEGRWIKNKLDVWKVV